MSNTKALRDYEIEFFDYWYKDCPVSNKELTPIEKIFYLWSVRTYPVKRVDGGRTHHNLFNFGLRKIEAQKRIDRKEPGKFYVVDFYLEFLPHHKKFHGNPPLRVVVELDGHDFHEKTKTQAARDKDRDRYLQSQGYIVARFTGSQIWDNPENCIFNLTELCFEATFSKEKEVANV